MVPDPDSTPEPDRGRQGDPRGTLNEEEHHPVEKPQGGPDDLPPEALLPVAEPVLQLNSAGLENANVRQFAGLGIAIFVGLAGGRGRWISAFRFAGCPLATSAWARAAIRRQAAGRCHAGKNRSAGDSRSIGNAGRRFSGG